MSQNSIRGRCPHCGGQTAHAFLPSVSTTNSPAAGAEGTLGLRADHRFVCSACEQSWEAAVIPKAQLQRLQAAVAGLDEATRQIAMLRLLMSKDQVERAEKSRQDVIKIHRAA